MAQPRRLPLPQQRAMEGNKMSAVVFEKVSPIGDTNVKALPVSSVGSAADYYTQALRFTVMSMTKTPAVLRRDSVEIGIAENNADPEQASCYFGVSDVDALRVEYDTARVSPSAMRVDEYNGKRYRVFFVREPYGVCFCFGQEVSR